MAKQRDYYDVLGVDRSASDRDVASAYRRLAIKYHPDSNPDDERATELFKEAAEAYEVLGDAEKRSRYDRYGHAGVSNAASGSAGFHDVEDIFDAFGDMFGGAFGDMFGGGGRRRTRRRRGAHVKTEVILDLEEAARGVTKKVRFRRSRPCETCSGSGAKRGSAPTTCRQCEGHGQIVQSAGILRVQTTCPNCQGSGRVITEHCPGCRGSGYEADVVELDVTIPAGVDDGMQVRLAGQGEPSPHGGEPGDCYCVIRVREHALFERDGSNLFLQMPISYTQAVLGATIDVPTLNGRHELRIPSGTDSGHLFRLRGCGMSDPRSRGRGDLFVRTLVEVPKKLNQREESLLRELAELEDANVTPHRKTFMEKIRDYFISEESATTAARNSPSEESSR